MKKYKILILAGGGPFGVIETHLLSSLGIDDVCEYIDAGGGTSVGSEIISGLASGISPVDINKMFQTAVYEIFKPSFWPTIRGAKYDSKILQKHLKKIIPCSYSELKIPVIIPTIDFKYNKFKVYDNIVKDEDLLISGYIPATQSSSVPTYFDPFLGCIDGGLVENIPIITTVTAIKDKLGIQFEDMNILAIGTGHFKYSVRDMRKVNRWFKWQWLSPLLELLTDSNEMASVFWAKHLGFNHFEYYNPVLLEDSWAIDEPHKYLDEVISRTEPHVENFHGVWDRFLLGD